MLIFLHDYIGNMINGIWWGCQTTVVQYCKYSDNVQ